MTRKDGTLTIAYLGVLASLQVVDPTVANPGLRADGPGLLSIAAAAPGGLMHDTMTLGSLLASPLTFMPAEARGQLAAIGAVAFFAAANRTPLFCALFVFTLQGDLQLLLPLLLASGVSTALAEGWRGLTWNEAQGRAARC